jgi:regulator of protease activity HflC (stomatin/prohibitin superfamily)
MVDVFLIVSAAVVLVVVCFLANGLLLVYQAEAMVVERLGRFHAVLTPGLQLIIPVLDKPRAVIWRMTTEGPDGATVIKMQTSARIDLREQVFDIPRQNVITSDNVGITVNALLYFQVTDPQRVVYEINNLPDAIQKLAQTSLRAIIGEMNLDDTLSSRDAINSKLGLILDEATGKWGVKVNRVEVQEITPPEDIRSAMEKQMRAERDRRAAILEAEGLKQAQILQAEGYRDAQVNQAQGDAQARIARAQAEAQAQAITMVNEVIRTTGADPTQYLIAMRYLDVFQTLAGSIGTRPSWFPTRQRVSWVPWRACAA